MQTGRQLSVMVNLTILYAINSQGLQELNKLSRIYLISRGDEIATSNCMSTLLNVRG